MKSRPEHLAVQEADAARFRWCVGRKDPSRLDQWRAAIDKAMQEEDKAEDEDLNRKLRESIHATGGHTDAA